MAVKKKQKQQAKSNTSVEAKELEPLEKVGGLTRVQGESSNLVWADHMQIFLRSDRNCELVFFKAYPDYGYSKEVSRVMTSISHAKDISELMNVHISEFEKQMK